jgi:hypothetical protein
VAVRGLPPLADEQALFVLQEYSLEYPSPRFTATWEADEDPEERGFELLADALEWAWARSPRVSLQLSASPGERVLYSAGAEPLRPGVPWHEPPRDVTRLDGHGGVVWIGEDAAVFTPRETFEVVRVVRTEIDGAFSTKHESLESGRPFSEALATARGLSDVVVIRRWWPGHFVFEDAGRRRATLAPLRQLGEGPDAGSES